LMRYDIESSEIDTIVKDFSNGGILDYKVGGNYFYCYHQKADDNNSVRYYISQYNIKNSQFEKEWLIGAMDGLKCYNLVYADETYLYLSLYESGCLYAVPHDDQTKMKLLYETSDRYSISQTVFHNDEFLILEISPENTSARLVRYRMDNTTAKIITVFSDIPAYNMYFTENFVYYTYDRKKELGIIHGTGEILKLNDSVIYRVSHTAESPSEEQVFAFPAEMEAYALQSFAVCGNYLYGYYIAWENTKEGYQNGYNSRDIHRIMRINLQSGEIYYINE